MGVIKMSNLFEELKELGFEGVEQVDLYAKEKANVSEENDLTRGLTVEDVLYDKSYTCPVCNTVFKSKAIRSGKNKLVDVELDLKANYDIVNPVLYECIVCENCGYAALSKNFNTLTASQIKWIKEEITPKYKAQKTPEILTEKDGVLRFKLALLNSHVKKARDGEKAYICLKLAWLYRDMKETELEKAFLQQALTGFESAYNKDRFPIFELDELTTAYIVADLNRRLGNYDKAMQWLGYVVTDRSVPLRLKTKALNLKAIITEEKNKAQR